MTQPRSVGVEHAGLHAASELGLIETLNDLGVKGVMQASILGNLIGRMGQPGSERATWNGLQQHSALGELIDVDFGSMSHMSLYRASDVLMKHREVIETRLFRTAKTLFDLQETVTLYDLSNTYFEGEAERNGKARRGRSKEKRSDCPGRLGAGEQQRLEASKRQGTAGEPRRGHAGTAPGPAGRNQERRRTGKLAWESFRNRSHGVFGNTVSDGR